MRGIASIASRLAPMSSPAKNHPSPAWALAGPAILPCFGIGLLPRGHADRRSRGRRAPGRAPNCVRRSDARDALRLRAVDHHLHVPQKEGGEERHIPGGVGMPYTSTVSLVSFISVPQAPTAAAGASRHRLILMATASERTAEKCVAI